MLAAATGLNDTCNIFETMTQQLILQHSFLQIAASRGLQDNHSSYFNNGEKSFQLYEEVLSSSWTRYVATDLFQWSIILTVLN